MKVFNFSLFLLAATSSTVASLNPGLRQLEPSCSSNRVTAMHLIDPESDEVVDPCTRQPSNSGLCDPNYINLNFFRHGEINILAETCSSDDTIECVKFLVDNEVVRKEKKAPYSLFGNRRGDFFGGTLTYGYHDIQACTYTNDDCSSGESGCFTWSIRSLPCIIDEDIFTFDPETDTCLSQLNYYAPLIVCLPESGKLTFVALKTWCESICFDKVHFELIKPDGSKDDKTEYHEPYSLYGNQGPDLFGASLEPGTYTIVAWANDVESYKETFAFEIIDDAEICRGWFAAQESQCLSRPSLPYKC